MVGSTGGAGCGGMTVTVGVLKVRLCDCIVVAVDGGELSSFGGGSILKGLLFWMDV